jgi:8-oxo-dGTP pyrophosphatase MutT (NUDIX family)
MTIAPWEVLSERVLVKDRWIELRAERCRTGGGAVIDDFYVLHYPDWVNAVAITPEGRFVCARQWREGAQAVSLEFAGGAVDAGETPEQAAERELLEETGYRGSSAHRIQSFWANPASHRNRAHTVLILGARKVQEPASDPVEQLEVEEMTPRRLIAAIESGELAHPLHAAAAFIVKLHSPELFEESP